MIEVVKPTDKVIIDVLERLLEGTYSRSEVYDWYQAITEHFATRYPGCIQYHTESKHGGFIVNSLCFIEEKGLADYECGEQYFLRDKDFLEYIAELKREDCADRNGQVIRIRGHQVIPVKEIDYPLVCLNPNAGEILEKYKIFFTRGIVDDLALPTEYAAITYNSCYFYMNYSHTLGEYNFSINGFKGSDQSLFELLIELGIQSHEITFYNNVGLRGPCALWRLDDNGNEFLVSEYETELEALLLRKEYEDKGHKQTYFTKLKSATLM